MSISGIFVSANRVIFDTFGVPVTYTPLTGAPIDNITALISCSLQTQPSGMGSETWGQHTTVELMLSDLPAGGPVRGDVVNDGSTDYILAAPMENNGQTVKWVVT